MLSYLILFPAAAALLALLTPSDRWRPWVLPLGSGLHLLMVAKALSMPSIAPELGNWLALDPAGKIILLAISLLHFLCMLYAPGYLSLRLERSNRVLCTCVLLSLSMMTLVVLSHHLGLMWVAIEATTLVTAPSLYFNHNVRSLEATWKYLVICSVGIALALLGSLFLAYSAGEHPTLLFDDLLKQAPELSRPWLHAAFILLLVGYGTKMGLSPMHTWKPDAYGEAPGMVGALMAGGVTSSVFFAIVRVYQLVVAGGDGEFAANVMIFMGLLSMCTAAVFMVRQRDFKRLLAYSSVEHMGILVFGLGISGPTVGGRMALYGTLLHVLNNAMTKGVLFLSAGNIHRAFGSKLTDDVRGAMRTLPLSGSLFLFGFLAGCGSPPFSPFVSEFTIVSAAFAAGHNVAVTIFLIALMAVFIGMGGTVLSVVLGEPSHPGTESSFPDGFYTGAPVIGLMIFVLWLGISLPPFLKDLLDQAVASLAPLS